MTMGKTVDDVRRVAREVVAARVAGKTSHQIGSVKFDLTESSMCLRFVRECHEAALGLHEQEWAYRAAYAIQTDYMLRRAGLGADHPEHADVVCFNKGHSELARPGHIGIYLGDGLVAENTVNGKRGTPRARGTKISTLDEIGRSRAMFFQTLPLAEARPALSLSVNGTVTEVGEWLDEMAGISYAPIGRLVRAMGGSVRYDAEANRIEVRTA
jgi:hypothetical protein